MKKIMFLSVLCSSIFLSAPLSQACTRVLYQGDNQHIVTARSMDWKTDTGTNLWILPKNVARDGRTGKNAIQWTSKYGSVVATGYDISTTDGLNEAGLAANVLWLVESEYPNANTTNKPTLSLAAWAQYVLDNYATVAEAIDDLRKEPFVVVTDKVPGEQRLTTLHLSISDRTGDSAIIEYIDGKQVIHHSPKYQVMTNSPIFEEQLALNEYWKQIGGTVMLPGTNRASDRFARASFYINAIPKNASNKHTISSVFSVIRNASVPFGLNTEEEPNISSTRWRTVADHKNLLYFFESAISPNTFWVDLKKINFNDGITRKLDLDKNQDITHSGDATAAFQVSKPFVFLAPQP